MIFFRCSNDKRIRRNKYYRDWILSLWIYLTLMSGFNLCLRNFIHNSIWPDSLKSTPITKSFLSFDPCPIAFSCAFYISCLRDLFYLQISLFHSFFKQGIFFIVIHILALVLSFLLNNQGFNSFHWNPSPIIYLFSMYLCSFL